MSKSTCCRECANRKEGWRKCTADRDQCQRAPDVCNDVAEGMYTAPNKCFSCGDFKPIAQEQANAEEQAALSPVQVRADVRPCEFTGINDCKVCPAPKCFYEPDDEGETYDYEEGMAPRTDATDKALANRSPREQYVIMRAHARALEIELRDVGPNKVIGS